MVSLRHCLAMILLWLYTEVDLAGGFVVVRISRPTNPAITTKSTNQRRVMAEKLPESNDSSKQQERILTSTVFLSDREDSNQEVSLMEQERPIYVDGGDDILVSLAVFGLVLAISMMNGLANDHEWGLFPGQFSNDGISLIPRVYYGVLSPFS